MAAYFNPDFNYSKAIQEAIKNNDARGLEILTRERDAKIASDPNKYANVASTESLLGDYQKPSMPSGIGENIASRNSAGPGPYMEGQNAEIDPLAEYKMYVDALTEAKACKDATFKHPDLVKDDSDENVEIL